MKSKSLFSILAALLSVAAFVLPTAVRAQESAIDNAIDNALQVAGVHLTTSGTTYVTAASSAQLVSVVASLTGSNNSNAAAIITSILSRRAANSTDVKTNGALAASIVTQALTTGTSLAASDIQAVVQAATVPAYFSYYAAPATTYPTALTGVAAAATKVEAPTTGAVNGSILVGIANGLIVSSTTTAQAGLAVAKVIATLPTLATSGSLFPTRVAAIGAGLTQGTGAILGYLASDVTATAFPTLAQSFGIASGTNLDSVATAASTAISSLGATAAASDTLRESLAVNLGASALSLSGSSFTSLGQAVAAVASVTVSGTGEGADLTKSNIAASVLKLYPNAAYAVTQAVALSGSGITTSNAGAFAVNVIKGITTGTAVVADIAAAAQGVADNYVISTSGTIALSNASLVTKAAVTDAVIVAKGTETANIINAVATQVLGVGTAYSTTQESEFAAEFGLLVASSSAVSDAQRITIATTLAGMYPDTATVATLVTNIAYTTNKTLGATPSTIASFLKPVIAATGTGDLTAIITGVTTPSASGTNQAAIAAKIISTETATAALGASSLAPIVDAVANTNVGDSAKIAFAGQLAAQTVIATSIPSAIGYITTTLASQSNAPALAGAAIDSDPGAATTIAGKVALETTDPTQAAGIASAAITAINSYLLPSSKVTDTLKTNIGVAIATSQPTQASSIAPVIANSFNSSTIPAELVTLTTDLTGLPGVIAASGQVPAVAAAIANLAVTGANQAAIAAAATSKSLSQAVAIADAVGAVALSSGSDNSASLAAIGSAVLKKLSTTTAGTDAPSVATGLLAEVSSTNVVGGEATVANSIAAAISTTGSTGEVALANAIFTSSPLALTGSAKGTIAASIAKAANTSTPFLATALTTNLLATSGSASIAYGIVSLIEAVPAQLVAVSSHAGLAAAGHSDVLLSVANSIGAGIQLGQITAAGGVTAINVAAVASNLISGVSTSYAAYPGTVAAITTSLSGGLAAQSSPNLQSVLTGVEKTIALKLSGSAQATALVAVAEAIVDEYANIGTTLGTVSKTTFAGDVITDLKPYIYSSTNLSGSITPAFVATLPMSQGSLSSDLLYIANNDGLYGYGDAVAPETGDQPG